MLATSLPAGDTVSPCDLGEPHTTTQHTVTGELTGTQVKPLQYSTCQHYKLSCNAPLLGRSHEGKSFSLGPVLVVECYLWETWDGWCTWSVVADKLSVTVPVCHQS